MQMRRWTSGILWAAMLGWAFSPLADSAFAQPNNKKNQQNNQPPKFQPKPNVNTARPFVNPNASGGNKPSGSNNSTKIIVNPNNNGGKPANTFPNNGGKPAGSNNGTKIIVNPNNNGGKPGNKFPNNGGKPNGNNGTKIVVGGNGTTIKVGTKINPVDPGKGKRPDPNRFKIGGAMALGALGGAGAHHLLVQKPTHERIRNGQLQGFMGGKYGQNLQLKRQFELQRKGDYTRQMNFRQTLVKNGGWGNRKMGLLDRMRYTQNCTSMSYCGSGYYPKYCYCPKWSPWVKWCWNVTYVPGWWDPRPVYCQPVYTYEPCQPWVSYSYPAWNPLVDNCGTWVDVPPVAVDSGVDLQLLAVRFVDGGHPEEQQGPRYRAWVRNNSAVPISQAFNVLAYAANGQEPVSGAPEGGVRVTSIDAGAVQSLDLRLPFSASNMTQDSEGHPQPFGFLHVIVDSHREVQEAHEENNGVVLARGDVLPVDPSLFGVDQPVAAPGTVLSIGGEGFGPEPGQVILRVGDQEVQPKILGWYDLGVQVELPDLSGDAQADLIVVRGDQAATNPYTITIQTAGSVSP